jgi:hypothetical protein
MPLNVSSLTTRAFGALPICALLLTALSLAPVGTAGAQEQQRSPLLAPGCTYDDCAIRVEDGWFSRRIIQGTGGREVARLGIGGPNAVTILGVNDQAARHARRYQSRQRTGTTLTLIGAVGSIATYIALLDSFEEESKRNTLIAINIGSLVTSYIGRGYLQSARRELDRAVWWFNQDASR